METPIQKGKINSNLKTLKTITPAETAREDAEMHRLRRSGQELKTHTPKKR